MPEKDGADPGTEESSSAMNGTVHFESPRAAADASVDQVADLEDDKSDYEDDRKIGEDVGKDEFVDAAEELNADNRDSAVLAESEAELDEGGSLPRNNSDHLENGEPDHDLMDEIRRLQILLEKAVTEKESASREYEEERERCTREISDLCHQIEGLTHQRPVVENGEASADHNGIADSGNGKEKLEVSLTSLRNMIRECSKLIGDASEERSQMEGSIRELHAALHTKDQQIEDLNSKLAELSVAQDVQTENNQHLEFATRRMLDMLAFVAEQEELVDGSVGGQMNVVERRTMALVERYSHIYYQIDQLRQYLPEAGSELLPDELGNVVSRACTELLEAKKNEGDLVERLRVLEVENEKLVEQLNKDKVVLEERNGELHQAKAELEQEKTRLANVKEKLSMAVTKGKSLVQQRESLKQSLAEKTSELERCMIELQEKSSTLEAAEATVEELRQNEGLVSLLQENLSQRNGILIKFEEILSEASLPEEIQSLDVSEKYRWLVHERNSLRDISTEYQKCRDALSLVELPDSLSTSDCESVVVWLKESFSQAKNEVETLQAEIGKSKESAHNEIDRLSASLSAVLQEKDYLESELDDLKFKYEEIVEKEKLVSSEKERMSMLLVEKSGVAVDDPGCYDQGMTFSGYAMLVDRCFDKMREHTAPPDCSPAEFELFESIKSLLYLRDLDLMLCEKVLEEEILERSEEVSNMSKELKVMSAELQALKEERGSLQKDLGRSEEKLNMLREKLSLAVKKGKGLVQDRENFKHLLDEKNGEIEKLKLEIQQQESAVSDCKVEISRMSSLSECIPILETDLASMKDQKDKLEADLASVKDQKGKLESDLASMKDQNDKLENDLASMKDQNDKLENDLASMKDEKDKLENDLASMKGEKDKLQQFLLDSNNMLERMIESVEGVEVPPDLVAEEPAEKIKWLAVSFTECQAAKDRVEQELSSARDESGNLTARFAETVASVEKMHVIEEELEKVKEEASNLTYQLREAQTTIKTLEDELSAAKDSMSQLAEERKEIEIGKINAERDLQEALTGASSQASSFAEASTIRKSLEDALLQAENNISLLSSEKEAAHAIRVDVERELEKMKEAISIQNNNLAEAQERVKSLEETVSELHARVALANEDRATLENELKKLQDETGSKASSLTDAFMTIKSLEGALSKAENHVSVLENENKISNQEVSELKSKLNACLEELAGKSGSLESRSVELVGHLHQLEVLMKDESFFFTMKKDFEKKVERLKDMDLMLNSMKSQMSSTHSEQVESDPTIMGGSLPDQLLPGDLGDSLNIDVESARANTVDDDNISSSFIRTLGGFHQKNKIVVDKFVEFSLFIDEVLSVLSRKLEGRRDEVTLMVDYIESLKRDMETTETHKQNQETAISMLEDAATFLLSACADVTKDLQYEAENKLLSLVSVPEIETQESGGIDAGKYQKKLDGSKYIKPVEDLLLAASRVKGLMEQFEETTKAAATKIENLKDELYEAQAVSRKALEEGDSKQNMIYKLEKDVQALQDSCSSLKLKEGEYQANIEKLKDELFEAQAVSGKALEEGDSKQNMIYKLEKDIQALQDLCSSLKLKEGEYQANLEKLKDELYEAQAVSRKALEEGNSKQNMIFKLEKDVQALQDMCSSLKLKEDEYQANFEKLKEREAEVSSMYSELSLKQQEAEGTVLTTSQWKALTDKIITIEIPSAEISGRDPVSNGSHVEKLFYIVDSFRRLQNQVDLLLHDKEGMQTDLAAKVLENKQLSGEVEMHSRYAQYSEKMKNDLSELTLGLEKMASMLGLNELAGEQKAAGAAHLIGDLEKKIMNVLLEFEASKSRTQELGSKLLGSQKFIDELSAKVKILEGSLQGRSVQPEVIQERGIFEATSVPTGSEISEIEDAESSGKSLISTVPFAAHVRTMRKGSTDHLALNIDGESQRLISTESDDEKGHKFKSLNTSGLIPAQGKLIADRVDGICVNGGRILMTRPGARLGLIAYWLFLHIWLLGSLL